MELNSDSSILCRGCTEVGYITIYYVRSHEVRLIAQGLAAYIIL